MTVILPPRRPPHELLLLVGSAILGVFYLLIEPAPTSVIASLPTWIIRSWAAAMLLSGLVGAHALTFRRNVERALRLESAAMHIGAGAMVLCSVSLLMQTGATAIGSGITFGLWTTANLWRSWQIGRHLREMSR